jgi:hypothetical protein
MRIKDGRLIGSLFNLLPATTYEIFAFDGTSQIQGAVSTQPDQLVFTPTTTLYVDDDAPPGGDGSVLLPFRTIQEAVNRAGPGTLVSVADGLYREAVTFPASGTPGNWIQVKAQGDAAILDSADYLSGEIWKPDTKDGVWSTVLSIPVYYLARDGNRVYQFEDKKGLVDSIGHDKTPMDEGWFYEPGTQKLYIRSLDNPITPGRCRVSTAHLISSVVIGSGSKDSESVFTLRRPMAAGSVRAMHRILSFARMRSAIRK